MWVPGHFHLTVGSASNALLLRHCLLAGAQADGTQALSRKWLALAQVWTWFFGMIFFSNAYHTLG
jgi:cytochrome c oxidase subunit 1